MLDRINPRSYPQFRSRYHSQALAALEPLRKALGYEPRNEVIPDQQHVAIARQATWDHRVTVPPGAWLWAVSGSSQQPEGFTVQITDFATRGNLFSNPLHYRNITGQGSQNVLDAGANTVAIATPLHLLSMPRPIVEPAVLNVQITNLSTTSSNEVQLVLWILEPPATGSPANEWNAELDAAIEQWRRGFQSGYENSSASGAAAPQTFAPATNPMLAPAYHQPFNTGVDGDNILVPGVPGMRIAIHQMSLYNTIAQNLRFLDGGNGPDLTGPLSGYGEGGSIYLPYQEEPHFVLSDGNPFVVNLTALPAIGATGAITGFVKYRLFKQWTAGF